MNHFISDYNETQSINENNFLQLYEQKTKQYKALITYNFKDRSSTGKRRCYVQIYKLVDGYDVKRLDGFSRVNAYSSLNESCLFKKYHGNLNKTKWIPPNFHYVGKASDSKWDIMVRGSYKHVEILKRNLPSLNTVYYKNNGHTKQIIVIDSQNKLVKVVHEF